MDTKLKEPEAKTDKSNSESRVYFWITLFEVIKDKHYYGAHISSMWPSEAKAKEGLYDFIIECDEVSKRDNWKSRQPVPILVDREVNGCFIIPNSM